LNLTRKLNIMTCKKRTYFKKIKKLKFKIIA